MQAENRAGGAVRGASAVTEDDANCRAAVYFVHAPPNQTRAALSPLDGPPQCRKRKSVGADENDGAVGFGGVRSAAAPPTSPLFGLEQRCVSPHFAGGRRVLGFVDVGRTNMGLCFTTNDWHWSDPVVERVARVDIAQAGDPLVRLGTGRCGGAGAGESALVSCNGPWPARGETADLVARFVVRWRDAFAACERIFVERQPPGGMRDIEQLLYAALGGGARVSFLAPNSLHAHFRIGARHGWGAYDQRKVRAETIAARYISANGSAAAGADWAALGERRHDAADATLMAILVNERKRREWVALYAPPVLCAPPEPEPARRPPKRRRGAVSRIGPVRRLLPTAP
ncbi:hypothetical protein [Pandoravirus japonicus]|uniref:Uncharacterized protein n=1 Tax=Pandoravirus japonicus TaxID=2823154 RepID=A0A811BQU0_9VIRU|nr:hypothetical protein [Pandoravirus japonicus]